MAPWHNQSWTGARHDSLQHPVDAIQYGQQHEQQFVIPKPRWASNEILVQDDCDKREVGVEEHAPCEAGPDNLWSYDFPAIYWWVNLPDARRSKPVTGFAFSSGFYLGANSFGFYAVKIFRQTFSGMNPHGG